MWLKSIYELEIQKHPKEGCDSNLSSLKSTRTMDGSFMTYRSVEAAQPHISYAHPSKNLNNKEYIYDYESNPLLDEKPI